MKVTYVLLRFPFLTETFVADEIHALRTLGVEISIISLLGAGPGPVQEKSRSLLRQVTYAPPFVSWELWSSFMAEFLRSPSGVAGLFWHWGVRPGLRGGLPSVLKRWGVLVKAVAATAGQRQRAPDRVHSHFAWLPGAAGAGVARLLGVPFTVTVHAYDLYARDELYERVCQSAERVFSISEYNRDFVGRSLPDLPVSIVRCGVDLEEIDAAVPEPAPTRDRDAEIVVVSVGSLVSKKGHDDLIRAVGQAVVEGLGLKLRIVGGGPLRGELERLVRDLDLEQSVTLVGSCKHDQIIRELARADIFALACRVATSGDRDGIPVALMEAGALRLPLISTRVSGIPELVRHQETGLLCSEGSIEGLAEALIRLGRAPELRREMGERARELVRSEFRIETNARLVKDLWQTD